MSTLILSNVLKNLNKNCLKEIETDFKLFLNKQKKYEQINANEKLLYKRYKICDI